VKENARMPHSNYFMATQQPIWKDIVNACSLPGYTAQQVLDMILFPNQKDGDKILWQFTVPEQELINQYSVYSTNLANARNNLISIYTSLAKLPKNEKDGKFDQLLKYVSNVHTLYVKQRGQPLQDVTLFGENLNDLLIVEFGKLVEEYALSEKEFLTIFPVWQDLDIPEDYPATKWVTILKEYKTLHANGHAEGNYFRILLDLHIQEETKRNKARYTSLLPPTQSLLSEDETRTNPYLVRFQRFEDRIYPVLTIPQGTVLYTYTRDTDVRNLYNLDKLDTRPAMMHTDLKFFYPIPYAGFGVYSNYQKCHIVTTTQDISLLCLVAPSPISRNIRHVHLYPDLNSCQKFGSDLCIAPDTMEKMNLNGYMAIAQEDSLTEGGLWEEIFKYCDNNASVKYDDHYRAAHFPKNVINQIVKKACLSAMSSDSVTDMFYKHYPLNFLFRRVIGIPEIVLSPLRVTQFSKRGMTRSKLFSMYTTPTKRFGDYVNYTLMETVLNQDMDQRFKQLSNDFVENRQCLLFHLYKPMAVPAYLNPRKHYTTPFISLADDIERTKRLHLVDFYQSYEKNEPIHTVLESVLYLLLNNSPVRGGGGAGGKRRRSTTMKKGQGRRRRRTMRTKGGEGDVVGVLLSSPYTRKRKHSSIVDTMRSKKPTKYAPTIAIANSTNSTTTTTIPTQLTYEDITLTPEEYLHSPSDMPRVLTMVNNIPIIRPNPNYLPSSKTP
jgi:hypothetical protein